MGGRKSVYKWSAIDRIGNAIITFAGNIILARLLLPADFGLVAIVGIFISIAYNISGCGMSDGLIHKKHPTAHDYSTVFVFNAVMGLCFCALFIGIAHPISLYFGYDELEGIMWALGICFFFSTLCFTQETRMRKEMDFKGIAIVKLSSTITAIGLGIYLAYAGYGYWALVSSRIFLSFFQFVYYILITRWMPKIAFYRESFNELFGYGVHLMTSYVFTQIGRNVNTFVLGKYSPAASGIFSQAQKMQEVPYGIVEAVFNWPFFSVLANEEDEKRRHQLSHNMFCNMLWISVTIGVLLILLSSPGFKFLFGEKWDAAIPVFRLLIIYGAFTAMKYFFQTILKAYDKTKQIRNLTILEVVLQLTLLALAFKHGVFMIAMSQVIATGIATFYYLLSYKKNEKVSFKNIVVSLYQSTILPIITFTIVTIGYLYWNEKVSSFVNLLLSLSSFLILFVAINELFKPTVYMNYRDKVISILNQKTKT